MSFIQLLYQNIHVAGVFYSYDHNCTLVIVETLSRNTNKVTVTMVTHMMHVFVVQSTWLNSMSL